MQTTFGCWSDAAACASCRNRLRRSSCRAIDSFITLIATVRSRIESLALYTTPIAPSPMSSMMWYLPISGIWVSAMGSVITRSDWAVAQNIRQAARYCNHRFSGRGVDRGGDFADRFDHRLTRLEQHGLEVEVPLDAAHDVIADHSAVPQIE